jgi:hypothetical protein
MTEENAGKHMRSGALREFVTLGRIVLAQEGFMAFKNTPRFSFDGKTPRQTVAEGKLEDVMGELASMYEGSNIV